MLQYDFIFPSLSKRLLYIKVHCIIRLPLNGNEGKLPCFINVTAGTKIEVKELDSTMCAQSMLGNNMLEGLFSLQALRLEGFFKLQYFVLKRLQQKHE